MDESPQHLKLSRTKSEHCDYQSLFLATPNKICLFSRITFCEMDFPSKCSTINQNLDQLIVDVPAYILMIEKLSERLDDKLGWKEFKFCFKLATSQIVRLWEFLTLSYHLIRIT